ncbi:hypothetical protein [Streptomonospora alba]|nr:hypothetical protein [Streptomonospora alba]
MPSRSQQGRGIAVAVMSTVAVLGASIVVLIVVMAQGLSLPRPPQLPTAGGGEQGDERGAPGAGEEPSDEPSPVGIRTPTADDPEALTTATVPGWKGVAVEKRGMAYDIPDSWFAEAPGVLVGFTGEKDDVHVGVGGSAVYGARQGPCYSYTPSPGRAGISTMGEVMDTAEGARQLAELWATLGYRNDKGDPELSVGSPEPFAANGLTGHTVTVEVQAPEFDCYPERAVVQVVSFLSPAGDDVFNLVAHADTAGAQAPEAPEQTLGRMADSLRPLP